MSFKTKFTEFSNTDIRGNTNYRNWRYEQEIAGLMWKINIDALHNAGNQLYGSKVSDFLIIKVRRAQYLYCPPNASLITR
jgi:hypothetical protein